MKETMRGLNQGNIQNLNRSLLLNLLRREKVCARTTLAEHSGLKQATVTHIINDFMNWNLVKEVGLLTGVKGRRSIAISLNTEDLAVAGIRIARQNFSVGLFNLYGEAVMIRRTSIKHGQNAREIMDMVFHAMDKMIRQFPDKKILALGLAIPGPYNRVKGRISVVTEVEGWADIPLKDEFMEHYKIPVIIEEHANAAALAQFWYSKETNNTDVLVYVAFAQGIGAGIVNNGALLTGSTGAAGEIGHTTIDIHGPRCSCGNYGCLEGYCSSITFVKKLNEAFGKKDELTFSDAVLLVRKKDPTAVKLYMEMCDYLSIGIINVINSFNPRAIVIGDEMAHVNPTLMLERVISNVQIRVVPQPMETTSIRLSSYKQDSMVYGAAIIAINDIFQNPAYYFDPEQDPQGTDGTLHSHFRNVRFSL